MAASVSRFSGDPAAAAERNPYVRPMDRVELRGSARFRRGDLLVSGTEGFCVSAASFFFSVGLHPLGARWIQEHYLVAPPQETYSYYGPFNKIAFNVGYHNEHHDLPSVPWNRLPDIRSRAPEMYNSLVHHTSWTKLLLQFIFDPRIGLYSRQERVDRSGVPLEAAVTPDLDYLRASQQVYSNTSSPVGS